MEGQSEDVVRHVVRVCVRERWIDGEMKRESARAPERERGSERERENWQERESWGGG